ncbi:MAG: succinate dehydrogenase, cytochrome b556 subunit [Alphaproteobacteria bacterium]
MTTDNRPLSPHLQVYKPQITSILSVLHRATGFALAAGTVLFVWWLISAAAGPGTYAVVEYFLSSWIGTLMLIGWSFAVFFHLCNGIRHLFWDAGRGFEIETVTRSGVAVVVVTVALTAIAWIAALFMRGSL